MVSTEIRQSAVVPMRTRSGPENVEQLYSGFETDPFCLRPRPEAIKLCPLVRHLRSLSVRFLVKVCVTAQHRDMLDQVLETFAVVPDYDLDLMQPGQSLASLTANILAAIEPVLERERPDVAVVQGDTTTTMAGALGAFSTASPWRMSRRGCGRGT